MTNTSYAALAIDPLRTLSVAAWLACLACLSPAVWRIVRRRSRYLDPIWCVVFLLAVNRLSYLLHLSTDTSHATAVMLAATMAYLTLSYQRADGRGEVPHGHAEP